MHLLIIVSVIAAATARHIPDSDNPYAVPAPTDFPRRSPHRSSHASHDTGVIRSQGNGDAIQEKPNFDERGYDHSRENKEDVPRYTDHFESHEMNHKRPTFEDEPKYFDNLNPQNVDISVKGISEEKQNHNRSSDDFGENDDHRNHKCIRHKFKNDKDLTSREQHRDKANTDNLDNIYNQAPKTNLNSTRSKSFPRDNEVTATPIAGRTIENEINGDARARNGSEDNGDKWVWSTTPTPSTGADLDNRAAFDGGVCPSGKVRIKGTDMCVEKDE